MTKKERDEAISDFASRIYSNMMEEVVMDVVLRAHREVARSRAICPICHTRCAEIHLPGTSNLAQQSMPSSSTRQSSQGVSETREGETGTNTPVNGKSDGNIYFECENCKRLIASNRYAPHLSSCLGLGNSRRGAARSATTKTKLSSEAGRSASPYIGSDAGNISEDGKGASAKGKSKSKAKRTDEAEFSLNRKRNGSPSLSPAKKAKKQKTSAASPASRVKSEPGTPNHMVPLSQTNSQSKIPSKLRETSILSSINREDRSSSPESRFSSPGRSVSTPTSTISFQSPVLPPPPAVKAKPKNGKPKGTGPPVRRPSPPRLPPPPPPVKRPEPDYLVDVEGDETGSSTDTDSS